MPNQTRGNFAMRLFTWMAVGLIGAVCLSVQNAEAGFPDGMNTYAAYHVVHGGLDPSGTVLTVSDRIVTYGDTVADLEKKANQELRRRSTSFSSAPKNAFASMNFVDVRFEVVDGANDDDELPPK